MKNICVLGQLYPASSSSPTCRVIVNGTTVYDGPVHSNSGQSYLTIPGEVVPIAVFSLEDSISGSVSLQVQIENAGATFALLGEIIDVERYDDNGNLVLDSNGNAVVDKMIRELEYPDEQAHLSAVTIAVADGVPVDPWENVKNGVNDTRGRHFPFASDFACQYQLVNL